ncbi:hypothetical protein ABXN37_27215 [Piscinibacter sakaiensis]|uniref:Uncharacterized protein n=1 Tax=Piscinibacter sakaiensis TaxID=1547922 RepID=A0A0K8P9D0_PISS1|nr:hypothetical protein [Piscinibacter sakaiensis]GAP38790.1 hypothetical protein ISF6_5343 [Piscinibacter sakaiensis]
MFPQVAEAWADGLGVFATQAEAARLEINARETSAVTSAAAASLSQVAAQSAQAIAQAAANNRGNWSSLTGALALPASVFHNGFFWVLLQSLANVATAEPGVSAAWVPVAYPGASGTAPDDSVRHRHLGAAAYTDMRIGPWGTATNATPPTIANGAQATFTVPVPGAVVGDLVLPPVLSISRAGLTVTAEISAANTATVVYSNTTGGSVTLASHTVTVYILRGI